LPLNGIFILAELPEEIAERIRAVNERHDQKLARYKPPHITLTGSSGVGPIPPAIGVEELRARLQPITDTTAPITLSFGPPHRFMQTDIIVLPIDPHGPIRILHDRLATSGLPFTRRGTLLAHIPR